MMECYPGIERTRLFSVLRGCMRDREPARFENRFQFPDGSSGWFELRMEPVPEGVAILSVDISARKRAEADLRRTMRALTTISRCNNALVRATDEARFLDEVCRIMVEDAGYASVWVGLRDADAGRGIHVAGQRHADGLDPALALAGLDDDERTIPFRALRRGQAVVERSDGSEAPTFATLALPLFGERECIGVLTVHAHEPDAFDDRERALLDEVALDLGHGLATLRGRETRDATMAALRQSRTRIHTLHDQLPTPILVWQRRGAELRLTHFNRAAHGLVERSSIGGTPIQVERTVAHAGEDIRECAASGLPRSREVRTSLLGSDEERYLSITYGFLPPDGVLMHVVDVTEQRETENQLRAAQRLEEVGRLAGGIAHDFNNLLSIISSYASFALEATPVTSPTHADLEEIKRASERAAILTRQLLAFSRRQVVEPIVTSWAPVVGGMEKMIRRILSENIELSVRVQDDLGNIRADPGQLEQVLINLLVNARDAMPRGGKLTIEMENANLDDEHAASHVGVEPGAYVVMGVSDSGTGMDPRTRAQVFEPFFTTKEPGEGTGLGLSTVYGIVRQHGGNIWLWSEPGHGTTFKVFLPRCDEALTEPRAPRASREQGNETILLVEDDDGVRAAAQRILESAGYRVFSAASAAEAEAIVANDAVELLVSDIVLPRTNGVELARRLRETTPTLKVLFMSGYTRDDAERDAAFDADAHFIAKPFSGRDLRNGVREVLDSV
jgi:signal transduction histidine kinase